VDIVEILDLGSTPPANAYLRQQDLDQPEQRFPLVLYFCRTCSLAQLLDVVDPRILFKNYHYVTGASPPSVAHFEAYAHEAVRPFIHSRQDLVIDIGGNDGVLLSYIKDEARVLNVDPADNLAPISEGRGVPFHTAFFTSEVATGLLAAHGPAAVVTANNVFAHTDPIRDVFAGVRKLIGDDGVFIFEVHWAKHLLEQGCFDQIYHEHLCFYSLHALNHLLHAVGLPIFDVEVVPTQGQSLRVYAARGRETRPSVAALLAEEQRAGLTTEDRYHQFAKVVQSNRLRVRELLRSLRSDGMTIAGYGAPAKGNTLLNYYGIGPETLEYLADSTPLKEGLYSPGMHIPIVRPERLRDAPTDYVLLLAWNFKDAILEREAELRRRGVRFIVTVPTLEVI
jgi:hypothetical protein